MLNLSCLMVNIWYCIYGNCCHYLNLVYASNYLLREARIWLLNPESLQIINFWGSQLQAGPGILNNTLGTLTMLLRLTLNSGAQAILHFNLLKSWD